MYVKPKEASKFFNVSENTAFLNISKYILGTA